MRMYRRNFDELCNEILYLFAKMWHKKEWTKALFNLQLNHFFGWFRVFPRKWDLGNEISGNCASTIEKGDGRPLKGLVVSQDQYHCMQRVLLWSICSDAHSNLDWTSKYMRKCLISSSFQHYDPQYSKKGRRLYKKKFQVGQYNEGVQKAGCNFIFTQVLIQQMYY